MDPFFENLEDGAGTQGFQWDGTNLYNMVAGHGPPAQAIHDLEEDVIPTGGQVDPPLGSEQLERRGRKKSFSTMEDLMLISAWLNVSLDQVVGINQTRDTYWNRIAKFFHTHKTFESDRTASSLIHRWSVIQADVNKFCGYYDGVVRRAPSGSTDNSKVTMALTAFETGEGNKFKLVHYREVLHRECKWIALLSAKKQKTAATSTLSGETADPIDANHEDTRPMGRKRAKDARRRSSTSGNAGGSTAASEAYTNVVEMLATKKSERDITKERLRDERAERFREMKRAEMEEQRKLRREEIEGKMRLQLLELEEHRKDRELKEERAAREKLMFGERIMSVNLDNCLLA